MLEKRLETLKKKFPKDLIDSPKVIEINGDIQLDRKQLATVLALSVDRVKDYDTKGMPRSQYSAKNYILYDLRECIDWIIVNVDIEKSKRQTPSHKGSFDEENLTDESLITADEADRRKKITDLQLARIKLREAEKQLVPADDLDRAMTEQAVMHRTKLDNDEKILPIILELDEKQTKLLREHNNDHLEMLDGQIERRFKKEPSNYDAFNEIIEARNLGINPNKIIEAIKSLY